MNEIIPDIREVQSGDLESLKKTLSHLTHVGNVTQEQWDRYLGQIAQNPLHKVFVAEYDKEVIGTVTCIITPRLIHEAGYVAHIEDVATSEQYKGKGIGTLLMEHCIMYAKNMKAYKMILDCEKDLIPFYKKFLLKPNDEVCMRRDL